MLKKAVFYDNGAACAVPAVDFSRLCKDTKTAHIRQRGGMKKTIWQKLDRRIARLKIFRNSATIIKTTVTTDIVTGATTAESVTLDIRCREPEKVSQRLIDNTLVYAGDLSLTLDYLGLKKLAQSNNLAWSETCAIFEPGKDEIQFAGVTYAVRSVIPQDWQNNQPGQYLVILKGVAPEETEDDDDPPADDEPPTGDTTEPETGTDEIQTE